MPDRSADLRRESLSHNLLTLSNIQTLPFTFVIVTESLCWKDRLA